MAQKMLEKYTPLNKNSLYLNHGYFVLVDED